jgi:hypothetical protein
VELAEWLFSELDQTGPPPSQHSIPFEYRQAPDADKIVRVFYAAFAPTVRDFQEIVTMIRTTTDTRRVFQHNARRAMIVRANPGQMELTEKLLTEFARQAEGPVRHAMSDEIRYEQDPREGSVRVFSMEYPANTQEFQELVTLLRTVSGARRVYQYNSRKAAVVRGTPDQLALVMWLFNELDRPASAVSQASPEFLVPNTEDVVRVFYLDPSQPLEGFQEAATKIRTSAGIRQAYFYGARRALTVRGTVPQVLQVAQIVQDAARP